VSRDPRCIDILTKTPGDLEARDELIRAEQDREDDAFSDRLKRLREAEEERGRIRFAALKSSTVARSQDEEVVDPTEEEDSGSSVRALTAAAEPSPPKRVLAPSPKVVAQGAQVAGERFTPETPTPEAYLRASSCLLRADAALMRAVMTAEKAKKARGARADPGALAMVIVEADALENALRAEMDHRGLPIDSNAKCSTQGIEEVVEVLRRLTGKAAQSSSQTEAYTAGLGRLRRELEIRAGLPRQKSSDQATE
jgi:hypothetical protein